jgi:hypothetical protein
VHLRIIKNWISFFGTMESESAVCDSDSEAALGDAMALSPSVIARETWGGRLVHLLDDEMNVGVFVAERRIIRLAAPKDLHALIKMVNGTARPMPAERPATIPRQQQALPIARSRTLTGNERSLVWRARPSPQGK